MVEQLDAPGVTPEAPSTDGHAAPDEAPGTAAPDTAAPGTAAEAKTGESAAPDERHVRWMAQLQSMIDDVASTAGPTMRELAAKAAELAAKAGEAAGPFAHRAAIVTSDVGQRVAARGREIATDLRRAAEGAAETTPDEAGADAAMPDPTIERDEPPPV